MNTKLSHSQVNRFSMCPKSYYFHYIEKLRPITTTGALLFGSALDAALNSVLLGKTDAEAVFEQSFTHQKINDVETYLPTSEFIIYANNDMDIDLLTEEDFISIEKKVEENAIQRCDNYISTYQTLKKKKSEKGFDSLSLNEKRTMNLLNWLSMRRKGFLMLKAYAKKVMPRFNTVHEVQLSINLENGSGDSVIGFVDLVADVKGHGTVILDNKTASRAYESDSVRTSAQLSLYLHALQDKYPTRKAGYIVLNKQLIKNRVKICSKCGNDGSGARHKTCDAMVGGERCHGSWKETIAPEVDVQFIIDTIPERVENLVIENIDATNQAIKHGVFVRNLNNCQNWFGGNCPYFDVCYKGKETNLCRVKGSGKT